MSGAAANIERRSMRRCQVVKTYGVSLSTIDRTVRDGLIRVRKVGKATLLNAEDCESAFGWPDTEPTAQDVADIGELMSR